MGDIHKRLSTIAITLSCLALIITLGVVFGQFLPKQPLIRVVDMGKLINEQAIRLAKVHAHGNVPQGVMQRAVDHIKEHLEAFGTEHNVILLAKGAVLSGDLVDVTQEIELSIADHTEDHQDQSITPLNTQRASHKRSKP